MTKLLTSDYPEVDVELSRIKIYRGDFCRMQLEILVWWRWLD